MKHSHPKRNAKLRGVVSAVVEALEPRQLLSSAPIANADTFTTLENKTLALTPGETSLYFNGDSYIYSGVKTWTTADGTFSASGSTNNVVVNFSGNGTSSTDDWTLDFAAPSGQVLSPGTYTNAARYPFESAGQPGLDVYGDGRGSNTVTGQFTVLQYNLSGTGQVLNFAANFDHHSEGGAAALDGTIDYQYVPAGFQSGVLANDTDPNGLPLTAQIVTQPAHGILFFNSDGTFSYTPAQNFNGTDQFTYLATDGTASSQPATVTINVTPVNQPPTFVVGADQSVPEDSGAHTVPNFLTQISPGAANESSQTVTFTATAANPNLFSVQPAIDPAGDLTYTLNPLVYGSSSVSVVATDNGGTANGGDNTSATKTFNINITHVNHPPVAVNDSFSTPLNTTLTIAPATPQTSLYFNGDSYIYNGVKTWTTADGNFTANGTASYVNIGFTGTGWPTSGGDDWTVEFAAPSGQNLVPGTYTNAARYPFQAADQPGMDVYGDSRGSNTVTGQFTILQYKQNSNGVVTNLSANFEHHSEGLPAVLDGTVDYNYLAPVGVLVNDTDPDGDQLTANLVAGPQHGTLTLNSDGSFTYVPDTGFQGDDTFTYEANDGLANSNPATVQIQVGNPSVPAIKSISGKVFRDTNADGLLDGGEPAMAGVQVFIDSNHNGVLDKGEPVYTTNSSGYYEFVGLSPGTYRVAEVVPAGYRISTPKLHYYTITVGTGTVSSGDIFGNVPLDSSISGTMFQDTNGNGKLDSKEAGLGKWKVYIDSNNDGKYDAGDVLSTTASTGAWSFSGLSAGTYVIRVVAQGGYTLTAPSAGDLVVGLKGDQSIKGLLFGEKPIH